MPRNRTTHSAVNVLQVRVKSVLLYKGGVKVYEAYEVKKRGGGKYAVFYFSGIFF
jgi:hypothetical protein